MLQYIIAVTWIAGALAFGALIAEFVVKLKRVRWSLCLSDLACAHVAHVYVTRLPISTTLLT